MMTKNQGQALAALVAELRSDWDAPGVLACIGHVKHMNAYEVCHALLRLADNPDAKTPGALSVTKGEHWRERSRSNEGRVAPRREEQCHDCGRHLPCGCEHNSPQRPRPASQTAMATALEEARQKLADSHTTQEAS